MPHIPQLTINLGTIQANYRLLAGKAKSAETAAAVKANAYGIDVAPVATALYEAGCRTFFTAYASESIQLRTTLEQSSFRWMDSQLRSSPLEGEVRWGVGSTSTNVSARGKNPTPDPAPATPRGFAGLGSQTRRSSLAKAGRKGWGTLAESASVKTMTSLDDVTIAPMHGVAEDEYAEAQARNITPVLNSRGDIEGWIKFARKQNKKLPAFIHLDTGMNRLGLPPDEQEQLISNPGLLDGIENKGWLSHYSCSEEFDNPLTTEQRDRFKALLTRLPKARASICNSSGIFWGRDYVFDLVRPGVAIYGVNPTPDRPNPMQGVVELASPILQIRGVDTPMTVGYGATHRITRKGRIATLALGYADGYLRALSSRGQVKIGSFLAPVVGRISMDLITVDISDVPESVAHVGAMATVIGPHRPVDTVAAEAGTTGYEILTSLGSRLQRHYISAGDA